MDSPLLTHPGAVPADGTDAGVAAHYGDPYAEERALVLSPQGHTEHHLTLADDGTALWAHVEPGTAEALLAFLQSMRFLLRVDPADVTGDFTVLTLKGPATAAEPPAYEALRIAAHRPRLGFDTDHKTLPHEVGWIDTAVHLNKGCYRGQETVARVHNLGHPPRRLVFLHLDGSEDRLPAHGDPVTTDGATAGFTGSAARHFELGPIALGLVKRTLPVDAPLRAGGVPAAQEVVVPPDAGANVTISLKRRGTLVPPRN